MSRPQLTGTTVPPLPTNDVLLMGRLFLIYKIYRMSLELTTRIYATIHAPSQVPDWFMPDTEMKSPKVRTYPDRQFGKGSGHEQSELYCQWYGDDGWLNEGDEVPQTLKDEVALWIESRSKEMDAADAYEKKWKIDRYFLWRKFYADKVTGNDFVSRPGSPEEIDCLENVIKEQDQVINGLKLWKQEAIDHSPDFNAIANLIGLKFGQNVSDKILPWMQEAARLLRMSVDLTDEKSIAELDGIIRKFITNVTARQ